MTVEPTGAVHPFAALFPMLDEEALEELADDIVEHGLRNPVVIDADGVLLDGRNRTEACRRRGIVPARVVYTADPLALILSQNVLRRHLSAGQQAMAVIEAKSSSWTFGDGRIAEEESDLRHGHIARAMVVHKYGHPHLCLSVIAGGKLTQAYSFARALKKKQDDAQKWAEEAERRRILAEQTRDEQLAHLRLAWEEIGPEVDIPPPPELSQPVPADAALALAPRLANIAAEEAYAQRMAEIKALISALAAVPVVLTAMPAVSTGAARSWATQVIALVYQIVEAHNTALAAERGLRSVS